jgi:hypothetical protein
MPHCKVCGNPVSKDETECSICGSALKGGTRRRQEVLGQIVRLTPDSKQIHLKVRDPTSASTPSPYPVNDGSSKMGVSRKLLVVVLVLAILLPLMAYGLFLMIGTNFPILVPGTPSGEFSVVTQLDNQTVRATFDDVDPVTGFDECGFRISTGSWTSPTQNIVVMETIFLFSPDINGYVEIFFWDEGQNGIINAGDYCTIIFPYEPIGLHGSIQIFYDYTGGEICSAQFDL